MTNSIRRSAAKGARDFAVMAAAAALLALAERAGDFGVPAVAIPAVSAVALLAYRLLRGAAGHDPGALLEYLEDSLAVQQALSERDASVAWPVPESPHPASPASGRGEEKYRSHPNAPFQVKRAPSKRSPPDDL